MSTDSIVFKRETNIGSYQWAGVILLFVYNIHDRKPTAQSNKKVTRLRLEKMDVQCTWVQQKGYCRVVPKINRVAEM